MLNGDIEVVDNDNFAVKKSVTKYKKVFVTEYASKAPVREEASQKREKMFDSAWLKRLSFDEQIRQINAKKT